MRNLGRFRFVADANPTGPAPLEEGRIKSVTTDQDEGELFAVLPSASAGGVQVSEDAQGLHLHRGSDHIATFYGRHSAHAHDDGSIEIRRHAGEMPQPGEKHDPPPVGDALGVVKLGQSMPMRLAGLNAHAEAKYGGTRREPEPVRDRGPHVPPGRVYGAGDPAAAPGQMQADIRAMNAAAAARYRS